MSNLVTYAIYVRTTSSKLTTDNLILKFGRKALAYPATTHASNGTNWKITQETDVIVLELEVGESMTKDKLEVATADHVLLVVRYKGHINDEWRASSLDVRLLMPPGNDDKNVKAIMQSNGWLKITIPKPKHELDDITIS